MGNYKCKACIVQVSWVLERAEWGMLYLGARAQVGERCLWRTRAWWAAGAPTAPSRPCSRWAVSLRVCVAACLSLSWVNFMQLNSSHCAGSRHPGTFRKPSLKNTDLQVWWCTWSRTFGQSRQLRGSGWHFPQLWRAGLTLSHRAGPRDHQDWNARLFRGRVHYSNWTKWMFLSKS